VALIAIVLLIVGVHGALHQDADGGCSVCCVQALEEPAPLLIERPAAGELLVVLPTAAPSLVAADAACGPRAPPRRG